MINHSAEARIAKQHGHLSFGAHLHRTASLGAKLML
jgi:hypothetical protein